MLYAVLFLFIVLFAAASGIAVFLLFVEKTKSANLSSDLDSLQNEVTPKINSLSEQLGKCKQAYANLRTKAESELKRLQTESKGLSAKIADQSEKMRRWQVIVDAEAEATRVLQEASAKAESLQQQANQTLAQANAAATELLQKSEMEVKSLKQISEQLKTSAEYEATQIRENARRDSESTIEIARQEADALKNNANRLLHQAQLKSAEIIAKAESEAKEIAGVAYEVKTNIDKYESLLRAVKNELKGYGDEYIIPSHSLLDDLAAELGFTEAGQKLKSARDTVKSMVKFGTAAECDYVETNRRQTAVRFVVDAFNGKVDSILSTVKHDNFGKLSQKIHDAFVLVNSNGEAFRNARISSNYLEARLEELKWAVTANELKKREQEEQRQIKERIREEQKARREYERALRDAKREEDAVQKAMARLQEQLAQASLEERAKFEIELADLQEKLRIAEEKGQRAISIAQQTRTGHVYIISNIGSFGEHVYKIGLTRRLEPLDRVRELGDSSVPFEFDVHALIKSDDAPALEHQLHRHFLLHQVNKVNHRKEFFRCDLSTIRSEVEALGLQAQWTMRADARDYRETLAIEEKISSDPMAREQWMQRQLELELTEEKEELVGIGVGDDDVSDDESQT